MPPNFIEPSSLPPLPQPPFFQHWVLEQPIATAGVLVLLAIVCFFVMHAAPKLGKVRLPVAGGLALLAIGVYALGSTIVTDRELLQQRSRALVQAVANRDAGSLRSMLDERCALRSIFASVDGADRIVDLAITKNPGVVSSAEVKQVNAGLLGPQVATTQIRVRTRGAMVPSLSWWRVDWQRPDPNSDAWVVTHIEPIWVQGISNPGGGG